MAVVSNGISANLIIWKSISGITDKTRLEETNLSMKIFHTNKGFTLLEMMVSISILAIVLVSVFRIQSSTIRLSATGKFHSTASHLARQKMAEIEHELRDPSMLSNELSGYFGDSFPDYRWQSSITVLDLSGSNIPEGTIAKKDLQMFRKIDIEISYNNELSFKVTSWRFVQGD
ncbi:MAG: prepilin-type N-terminal cleavage/methylation domain-containing protein [Desulfamplus sp.]|nr:prepilin-type N-terminal cleavage/methylation domain-containing protein [Desulfamplus sp.]